MHGRRWLDHIDRLRVYAVEFSGVCAGGWIAIGASTLVYDGFYRTVIGSFTRSRTVAVRSDNGDRFGIGTVPALHHRLLDFLFSYPHSW